MSLKKTLKRMKKRLKVGKDLTNDDIKEFYYTVAATSFPPYSERYYFKFDNFEVTFSYVKKKGKGLPLTDEDIIENLSKTLNDEEKRVLFECLNEGFVEKRKESIATGESGPWIYLYYDDCGDKTEFSFANNSARDEFLSLCRALMNE